VLEKAEPAQLPGQLEGREDGVLGGECYQTGTGQGPIGIDARSRVSEGVLLAGLDALITATSHIMGHGQNGTPIQKDLDDLIVVAMGGQDQGRNVWREGGSILRGGFPALEKIIIHLLFERSKVLLLPLT